MVDVARKERLTRELGEAELQLDALARSMEPGMMRTQQAIAGQRAKVLGLRMELLQIKLRDKQGDTEGVKEQRAELRAEWNELRLAIKEAELSARAASRQAADDELAELIDRAKRSDLMQVEVAKLHH